jgi:hypothetical protein
VVDEAGLYWVTVSGRLPFAGNERFSSAPVPVQLVPQSAEFLRERQLYDRALAILRERADAQTFEYSRRVIDEPSGNRLLRIGTSTDRQAARWWQVELTPAGAAVAVVSKEVVYPHHLDDAHRERFDVWFTTFERFEAAAR